MERATEILIDQSEFSERKKLCYPTSRQLFAIEATTTKNNSSFSLDFKTMLTKH